MGRTDFTLLFLLSLVSTLVGCESHIHPLYQPIPDNNRRSNIPNPPNTVGASDPLSVSASIAFDVSKLVLSPHVEQGYQDSQIDGDTYFVTYINYISLSRAQRRQINPRDDKWIMGAQEYVLYRAGELAKAKGARYVAVLYQDDWNVLNTWSPQHEIQPGAGLVVRLLNGFPSAIPSTDGRVYDVDMLLQTLPENNHGLAEYANKTRPDESVKKSGRDFHRWRASVDDHVYGFVPEVGALTRSRITKDEAGEFQITTWEDTFRPISPIQFLWQCVTLARQEGWTTFKLENWGVREQETGGTMWFVTTAKIIPNSQKSLHSIEPVFLVDKLFQ